MTVTPNEIRVELGLAKPPFMLKTFADYLGVEVALSGGVSAARLVYHHATGTVRATLPEGKQLEVLREQGFHELGHVANGDVGPHRPVLYARGGGRGAGSLSPTSPMEVRATDWGIAAQIPEGSLRLSIFHDEIRWVSKLAARFFVNPRQILQAARRYGLDHLLVRDPDWLVRYYRSHEYVEWQAEQLAVRTVCERSCCGARSGVLHHRRYDRVLQRRPEDVEALCWPCHDQIELSQFQPGQLNLLSD